MKSTMQYLVLGLALAGVPLLAEADEQDAWGETRQINQTSDAHALLNGQDELHLLQVEQRGEQAYLRLQNQEGEQLLIQTLAGAPEPLHLPQGTPIRVAQEHSGWSISHDDALLAFIPNQRGQDLLFEPKV
ncbi:MAG: hypothetical protein KBE13_00985 [Aeromonadaceae bacterium]|jgi:hypothetical protein|nr:hypothetical protein [Aeromonadaceae bacterium]